MLQFPEKFAFIEMDNNIYLIDNVPLCAVAITM